MSWSEIIHLYAGPTCWAMPPAPDLVAQPPAAAGDMLRRRHDTPCTLVLIDGFFDQVRSPWHKELLLLRARGFRIIGAGSMGALRAAELDTMGMLGVGAVYRAFRAGRLTGDGISRRDVAQLDRQGQLITRFPGNGRETPDTEGYRQAEQLEGQVANAEMFEVLDG